MIRFYICFFNSCWDCHSFWPTDFYLSQFDQSNVLFLSLQYQKSFWIAICEHHANIRDVLLNCKEYALNSRHFEFRYGISIKKRARRGLVIFIKPAKEKHVPFKSTWKEINYILLISLHPTMALHSTLIPTHQVPHKPPLESQTCYQTHHKQPNSFSTSLSAINHQPSSSTTALPLLHHHNHSKNE